MPRIPRCRVQVYLMIFRVFYWARLTGHPACILRHPAVYLRAPPPVSTVTVPSRPQQPHLKLQRLLRLRLRLRPRLQAVRPRSASQPRWNPSRRCGVIPVACLLHSDVTMESPS